MNAVHHTPPRLAPHARAVVAGLNRSSGRPRLPAWVLRDRAGASRYGALTHTPEHYQERTWDALLAEHAPAIAATVSAPRIVELEADGLHALTLSDALLADHGWLHYIACATTDTALDCALARLRGKSPQIELEGRKVATQDLGRVLAALPSPRVLVACGAGFADLDPAEATALLACLRAASGPEDVVVMTFDLAPDHERACDAYRDAEGNGARLGLRALERVNQELGADFELAQWKPEVRWNDALGRVELVVVASDRQRVFVDELGLPLQFEAGDAIQTATFQKHDEASIERLLAAGGFRARHQFIDDDARCAIIMAVPA